MIAAETEKMGEGRQVRDLKGNNATRGYGAAMVVLRGHLLELAERPRFGLPGAESGGLYLLLETPKAEEAVMRFTNRLARRLARGAESALLPEKATRWHAIRLSARAARDALGQGAQANIDGPTASNIGRSVAGPPESHGWWAAFHVRQDCDGRLPRALVRGGMGSSADSPICRARHTLVAISRATRKSSTGFKARMGLTSRVVLRRKTISNTDYAVSFTPTKSRRSKVYNFGTSGSRSRRPNGISACFTADAKTGQHLPHLFVLRARSRHDECAYPLSRPDAWGATRRGFAVPDGWGASGGNAMTGASAHFGLSTRV